MIRRMMVLAAAVLTALVVTAPAQGAEPPCELQPDSLCFGVESLSAALSTSQAGAHPDLSFNFDITKDPNSPLNVYGLHDSYTATRNVRVELPPGLIGDPNVLGTSQQCTVAELSAGIEAHCPNGSQVGTTRVYTALPIIFAEPVYMMQPPGGDVVARLGFIAGFFPTFIDVRVRSEGDYGITSEIVDSPAAARLIRAETTLWGVPAAPSHDTERCTIQEAGNGCVTSPERPPGSRPLPFFTNPTSCGVPLNLTVAASSWAEPDRFDAKTAAFPTISGCNSLPFGPSLSVLPTNRRTSSPTGLDMTIQLPPSDGVNVLEPSQTRDIRISLPRGISINPGSADGLTTCSVEQVKFKERVASECPDAAKIASTEFEIGGLPRRMKGAIYLREPEPGNLFRVWVVADDLGAHVKLPGQLEVDEETGQVESVVLDNPQVPLREVKLAIKSGFRAPLTTPASCGTYLTHYEFTPWSGGPPAIGDTPMAITEGCDGGGFSPRLTAGSTDPQGGDFSPYTFTIGREDSEQNLASIDVTLPKGMSASFVGIPHCEGAAAETGACPPASRIGRATVAVGDGPRPLWLPQPGKRPTAVYLGGPYKSAPLSIIAVVPAQAGPFDLGDEVVRTAVYVGPETAEVTAKSDPLPQFKEGIPVTYKTVNVQIDRQHFVLNPTSCARKETTAALASIGGKTATATSPFAAVNCGTLPFRPSLKLKLLGRNTTHRAAHPRLRAVLRTRAGDANIGALSVALPSTEFVDNEHFLDICTRVLFAAHRCPADSVYGFAVAKSPLFDFPLEGPVYLRSAPESKSGLPDLVVALSGPPSMPIEFDAVGHVDSVNGGLRTTFDFIPDAPVSKFVLQMRGGDKGLVQNSENLCLAVHRATAKFTGQNGKHLTFHPVVEDGCEKHGKGRRRHHRR